MIKLWVGWFRCVVFDHHDFMCGGLPWRKRPRWWKRCRRCGLETTDDVGMIEDIVIEIENLKHRLDSETR